MNAPSTDWLRKAQIEDVPAMQSLIVRSGLILGEGFYTPVQAEAITREVFGVDTQLILDQTYFVIERAGGLVACGGWSRRNTLFGGDQTKQGPDPVLDPEHEPARIRAFFVAPEAARQGLASRLLDRCMQEAGAEGFRSLALVSTLPGEPFYRAHGFIPKERFDLPLSGNTLVPVVSMLFSMDN